MAEFKMAAIIELSENEWVWVRLKLVWVRVRVEWECFWVNLREGTKVFESKMAEFKMAAIIKLSHNEWVKFYLCKWWEPILASGEEGSEVSLRGKTKMASLNSRWHGIQDGRIQDGCHHQVEWEWMSLSQIELVWVRVRVEWECFEWIWEKIPRCLNPRWQNSRWLPSSSWVRMNEWSFFSCKWWGGRCEEVFFVQMVGTNLGKCESVWEENLRWQNSRWQNSRWQNSRWLPSSSWVRMNEFESY